MERPRRHRPSQYQLGLDFGHQPLGDPASEVLWFTYEVKENVHVREPDTAGAYLLSHVFTPFDAFQQEEVWVLSLNNKGIAHFRAYIYARKWAIRFS